MNATQIRKSLPDAAWRRLESGLAMPALLVTPARARDDINPGPGRVPPDILDDMIRLLGADRCVVVASHHCGHPPLARAPLPMRPPTWTVDSDGEPPF